MDICKGLYNVTDLEYIDKDIYVPNGNGVKNPDAGYLEYNEFIVYNVNQARLRYVLKIHFD